MRLVRVLLWLQKQPVIGFLGRQLLVVLCAADIPPGIEIPDDLELTHRALGVVIHPDTKIGRRVTIQPFVTIGFLAARADIDAGFAGVTLGDDVIVGTGARVLAGDAPLIVGRGTIVGANSVLARSTGEWEIWMGVPARCVGKRNPLN